MRFAIQNMMMEWAYTSGWSYSDPFNEVELDVIFTDPDGEDKCVPAFWAGENVWRIRYASPKLGRHQYRTVCSDTNNPDLHGQEGELEVQPYGGDNPLFKHGPLRVSENCHYLEHLDGTPFFWLGDTWWYGLVRDFRWPGEFQELVADRVKKGFNLIQIVAGYLPVMPEGDLRCGNEAGLSWDTSYQVLNPAYFDMADLRIDCLVRNGLVPCIVSMWGYWLIRLGVEKVKRHWRYLVARYGAYPVVWCLCGEVTSVYPNFWREIGEEVADTGRARRQLARDWSDVCRYVGRIDPYGHPLTAHPNGDSRNVLDGNVPLSVCMLHLGHDIHLLPKVIKLLQSARTREPKMPVINAECTYESILGSNWQDVQRFVIWSSVLEGAAGHTYGAAEGCWQIHHRGQSPFPFVGGAWGEHEDWRDIAALPGSGQMQWCRRLMERYRWWDFDPHADWIDTNILNEYFGSCFVPRAAGIPGAVRIIYLPPPNYQEAYLRGIVRLEPDTSYRAYLYDPRSGEDHDLGQVMPEGGCWVPPPVPNKLDWVIVLETPEARVRRDR